MHGDWASKKENKFLNATFPPFENQPTSEIQLSDDEVQFLKNNTKYNENEIEILFEEFKKSYPNGKFTSEDFIILYESLTPYNDAEFICKHVFETIDINQKGYITAGEFIHWLGNSDHKPGTESENNLGNEPESEAGTEAGTEPAIKTANECVISTVWYNV